MGVYVCLWVFILLMLIANESSISGLSPPGSPPTLGFYPPGSSQCHTLAAPAHALPSAVNQVSPQDTHTQTGCITWAAGEEDGNLE